MNQCDRIKMILQENSLKQKELAHEIGVTESYISKLIKNPNIRLSQSIAALIEQKYGYNPDWILSGIEPKFKQFSKCKSLSILQQKAIAKLEKMNDKQIKAVLIFINSINELEKSFITDTEVEKDIYETSELTVNEIEQIRQNLPETPEEFEKLFPPVKLEQLKKNTR